MKLTPEQQKRMEWIQGHPLWHYEVPWDSIPILLGPSGDGSPVILGGWWECITITTEIRDGVFYTRIEAGGWEDLSLSLSAPSGGWTVHNKWAAGHDPDLDCEGESLEDAFFKLADLVERHYGGGRERLDVHQPNVPTLPDYSKQGHLDLLMASIRSYSEGRQNLLPFCQCRAIAERLIYAYDENQSQGDLDARVAEAVKVRDAMQMIEEAVVFVKDSLAGIKEEI